MFADPKPATYLEETRGTFGVLDLIRRLTNDGHAILREIDVAHPAAKSMIELSRTQDEEVGDGTTSVIILGKLGINRLLCDLECSR